MGASPRNIFGNKCERLNDKRLMPASYEAYLTNHYRSAHPAPGIPVILSVRSRSRREWTPPADAEPSRSRDSKGGRPAKGTCSTKGKPATKRSTKPATKRARKPR